jgi:hypothetical protein
MKTQERGQASDVQAVDPVKFISQVELLYFVLCFCTAFGSVSCDKQMISLTDLKYELPVQRISIVQDTRISECIPYLRSVILIVNPLRKSSAISHDTEPNVVWKYRTHHNTPYIRSKTQSEVARGMLRGLSIAL